MLGNSIVISCVNSPLRAGFLVCIQRCERTLNTPQKQYEYSYRIHQRSPSPINTVRYAPMREGWKSQLFNPDSHHTPEHLGFPMSTAQGRRILGVCHETWKRWEEIAIKIPEYKLQQLKLKKLAEAAGAIAPIVPYQVWVIGKVGEVFEGLPHGLTKKWLAQEYINTKKDEFSRKAYEEEQARYISLILN